MILDFLFEASDGEFYDAVWSNVRFQFGTVITNHDNSVAKPS